MDELVNETGKYWNDRYVENRTGWDLSEASPPLRNYIDTLTNKNAAILIPGCGNAYEAEYLLSKGFTNVTLIDIAPTLVDKLKQQFKGKPINIILGNFFDHTGKYDLMLEQTFFCALDPSLRKNYVEQSYSLLNANGKIVGVLFASMFEKAGPPFGGTKEEYEPLFKPKFKFLQFDICKTSIAPRMGNELFIEFEKKSS